MSQTTSNEVNALIPLRVCSFNPEQFIVEIEFPNSNGTEKSYYLPVDSRIRWFNHYCDEHGIKGTIIEEPASQLGTNFIQAVAKLMMDGEVVAQGIGGVCVDTFVAGDKMLYAVQQAATIAKGRALANAGFSTAYPSVSQSENGGNEIPCDAGIKVSDYFTRNPFNPLLMNRNTETPPAANTPQPNNQPTNSPKPANPPRSTRTRSTNKKAPAPAAAPAEASTTHNAVNSTQVQNKIEPAANTAKTVEPMPQPVQPAQPATPVQTAIPAVAAVPFQFTKEEAEQYIIPKGRYAGQKLGDVYSQSPATFDYYLREEVRDRYAKEPFYWAIKTLKAAQ